MEYQSIDVLLALQHPRSPVPAELTFYIAGQVKELLFKLCEQLCQARDRIAADELTHSVALLRRTRQVLDVLTTCWDLLGTLTPTELNAFRDQLGQASGVQSFMYRMVEYVLGNKDPRFARLHRHRPEIHGQVQHALNSPSVYDAALDLLHRHGADIPAEVLNQPCHMPRYPHLAVERAWARIYRSGQPGRPLFDLAEALIAVAEGMSRWRALHLLTVERVIGTKRGSGGTTGVAWLRRAAQHRFFPELWSARNLL